MSFPYADPREAITDLEEGLLRPEDAPGADVDTSPWTVTDEESAAWALTRIRQARETAARRNAPALLLIREHEAAIAALQATVDANNNRAQGTVDWFTIHLTRWHREQYEADPDPKHRTTTSIDLPGGMLVSRQTSGRILAADVARLDEEFHRVKVEPDKNAIKAHIKASGEIPDGVQWEHPRRVFGVEAP